MNRKLSGTVLLSAYVCCPGRGSEPGYGWAYLLQYAKTFEKVIMVTSTVEEGYRQTIDKLREMGIDNVRVEVVRLKGALDRLSRMPVGGIHLHYLLWLNAATNAIQSLPDTPCFAHHLTFGNLQYGSPLYKVSCPFIFGPVGGGQKTNKVFYPLMGRKAMLLERIRNMVTVLFYHFSPFFKGTIHNASLIYCCNEETRAEARRFLPPSEQHKVKMMTDAALDDRFLTDPVVRKKTAPRFSALWVGRLLPRKGVEILLNIAKLLKEEDFQLTMIGDGPLRETTLSFIRDKGLEKTVNFLGWMDQQQILEYYRSSDLLLFLSYRDSTGVQIVEAFSQGVPVLSFDQFGAALVIDPARGIKVPLQDDLPALQQQIADTIRDLIRHPEKIETMRTHAMTYAAGLTWDSKMATMMKDSKPFLKNITYVLHANADLRLERV
ncbi:MAG TPA: glycosyltransferase [Puia sp.]|jgi:glycosyltransferase involved in cell wall biosynthesis